jgi:hypothetical protein
MKPSRSKSTKTTGKKRGREEAAGAATGAAQPMSPLRPDPSREWKKSKMKTEDLLALLIGGFIREKEVDSWRAAAGDLYPMEKSEDEIPMFARFAECGLALLASDFFKGLLGYYGVEYLNLNPNGIFHTVVFIHFCEAFLGIKPHWILFKKFFRVKPQLSASNPRVVGGVGIQMREDAAEQYLAYKLIDSNQIGRRGGSTSRTTTPACRSRAGGGPDTGTGGTWSPRCRRGSSSLSCWRASRSLEKLG